MSLKRDDFLFRIYPSKLTFQLDRFNDPKAPRLADDYESLKRNAKSKKSIYGVFGYIKMPSQPYLILIEEASIVGTFMKAIIYRVEKLEFVPLGTF